MPTRLKDTDVVVIGLGMAGGVGVLPLAQAGIEVIGLEAGSWLTRTNSAGGSVSLASAIVQRHTRRRTIGYQQIQLRDRHGGVRGVRER